MPGWRSQWRLVLLNSLTCGLEICVAAGITYVPPLLLEAGVEERYMTMVLGKGLKEVGAGVLVTQACLLPHSVCECKCTCVNCVLLLHSFSHIFIISLSVIF